MEVDGSGRIRFEVALMRRGRLYRTGGEADGHHMRSSNFQNEIRV